MSNVQIPNLPVAIALNGTEALEAVQSGTSVQTTVARIAQYSYSYYPGFYISQLPAASSVNSTDIFPVVQGSTGPNTGTAYKATVAQLFTSPTFTGTTTLGGGAVNYVTVAGGTSGNPVTFTSVGGDASPDMRFVLPNRGAVSVPRLSIGNFTAGTPSTSPRLMSLFADQTMSGAGGPAVRIGGIMRGSLTSNLEGIYTQVLDEDRVAMSNTNNGILVNFMASTMRAGWSGGRTLHQTQLYVGNPLSPGVGSSGTAGPHAYQVSGASFAYSYDSAGGVIGAHRGNLFGRNDATRVRTGSGQYWNSTFGNETDVGVTAGNMVLWKGGIKVVKWSDDAVPGLITDFAYGINDQAGASSWRVGWQIGGPEGAYPFGTNSQIMSYFPGLSGTPVAATGINFLGITFGRSTFESAGFRVGPTGNVGSLVASGGALQTRSAIVAKIAVVNTITVLEGGLYSGAVTLTCSASPGGGTLATATVATYACEFFNQVAVGGSGYVVGDTITLTGGTFSTACVGTVNKVDGSGAVQGVEITTAGIYSVPPVGASATTTSGAGTGCTLVPFLKILTVTVLNAGTLYDEFLPPTITSSGAVSTTRQALLQVTMTATAAPIVLANNYANYATFTGATATGVFDTGAPVFQAAGADTHMDFKVLGKGNGRFNTTKLYVGASANRADADDATISYLRSGMTYATTAAPGFLVSGGFAGTVTSGQAFYHQVAINSDTVDPTTGSGPMGTHGFYVGHTVSAGAKGGRTALTGFLNVAGAITASATGDGAFYTASGARAQASASAGGSAGLGNGRGNLFGGNRIANLLSGATFWNSLIGDEITLAAETGSSLYYKNGFQIVLGSTDTVAGTGAFDTGLLFTQQINGASPGWDKGISFGHALGWWPIKATGTLIGTVASTGGLGPAYAAAYGVDFSAVTFSTAAFKSNSFEVDGIGRTTGAAFILTSGGPRIVPGTGVPSALLVLTKGSLYLRTDGAVGSTLYVSQGGGTWNAVAGV